MLIKILLILIHYIRFIFFSFYSASERLLEMLGTVVAYVDDVLVGSLNNMYMYNSF